MDLEEIRTCSDCKRLEKELAEACKSETEMANVIVMMTQRAEELEIKLAAIPPATADWIEESHKLHENLSATEKERDRYRKALEEIADMNATEAENNPPMAIARQSLKEQE